MAEAKLKVEMEIISQQLEERNDEIRILAAKVSYVCHRCCRIRISWELEERNEQIWILTAKVSMFFISGSVALDPDQLAAGGEKTTRSGSSPPRYRYLCLSTVLPDPNLRNISSRIRFFLKSTGTGSAYENLLVPFICCLRFSGAGHDISPFSFKIAENN
jgi:hypothetical protein